MQQRDARERVEEIRGFYIHLIIFVMVNLFLLFMGFMNSFIPAIFMAMTGWLIGLIIHGLIVFIINGLLGRKWEERKIKLLAKKD